MAPAIRLSKEIISSQPVTLVSPACLRRDGDDVDFATFELSNTDLLLDYYESVLLVYDAQLATPCNSLHQQGENTRLLGPHDKTVRQLHRALEDLLVYYPSAAGRLVHNESDGRLEVRYPVPNTTSVVAASGQVSTNLSNLVQQHASMGIKNSGKPSNIHASTGDTQSRSRYGVPFQVTHASVTLSDLGDVSDPHPSLDLLYPSMPPQGSTGSDVDHLGRVIMAFQITTFKCGGFALAHTCSHVYGDGYTGATFLQNLCSIARGARLANPPDFSRSRRVALSSREPPSPTVHTSYIKGRKRTTPQALMLPNHLHSGTATRYTFSLDALEALRLHVSKPNRSKSCSRNQALMALLWTAYARVRLEVQGFPGSHEMVMGFPMNLRTRSIPNLTAGYMGNALFLCIVCATLEELCKKPLDYVVEKIKSAMESLDIAEELQSAIDEVELKVRDGLVPYIEGAGSLRITSLVGLPFYDTDCGWGRPIYVGHPSQQRRNLCIIQEHPAAQAWDGVAAFAAAKERACFEEAIATRLAVVK